MRYMKRKVLWLLTVTVLFVALFPLAIDRFILGNSYPSNASNAEWMSFFGGYFGAIIGGFLSLVGIAFTIRFTREESRADRELQIRPVFDIYCHYLSEVKENWLGYVMVCVNDSNDSAAEFTRRGAAFVRLKNVMLIYLFLAAEAQTKISIMRKLMCLTGMILCLKALRLFFIRALICM